MSWIINQGHITGILLNRCHFIRRCSLGMWFLALPKRLLATTLFVAVALLLLSSQAQAGFLVGNSVDVPAAGSNDKIDDVKAIIDDYNATNDPDLITAIALFKKTDDDAGDLFNITNDNNGFSFFEADMTTAITSGSALTDGDVAYFSYTGPENIMYYSVKTSAGDGFSLYAFMAGLNLLDVAGNSSTRAISHVSFLVVPEPGTTTLVALGLAGIMCRRRWRN